MNEDMQCDQCGTDFTIDRYGDGECPKCGRRYEYDEGIFPVLDQSDWDAIARASDDGRQRNVTD